MKLSQLAALISCWILSCSNSYSQSNAGNSNCNRPATIVLFRTWNIYSFKFSYNLFAGDSLLGRIKTKDVFILETFDNGISFHATTKAPSLNEGNRSNYQKTKTIRYPFSLQQGKVYFVKCDFLNQRLFDYPRQPTVRLLKKDEIRKYLRKGFLKRKIRNHLYHDWLSDEDLL